MKSLVVISYLFQSLMFVDSYKTIPVESEKTQVILTVPAQCLDCLKEALGHAESVNKKQDLKMDAVVLFSMNWEKARIFLTEKKFTMTADQQKLVFVDPGGRFVRDQNLSKSSFVVLTSQGKILKKGSLGSAVSFPDLLKKINVEGLVK